jgi:hypothetical protein
MARIRRGGETEDRRRIENDRYSVRHERMINRVPGCAVIPTWPDTGYAATADGIVRVFSGSR